MFAFHFLILFFVLFLMMPFQIDTCLWNKNVLLCEIRTGTFNLLKPLQMKYAVVVWCFMCVCVYWFCVITHCYSIQLSDQTSDLWKYINTLNREMFTLKFSLYFSRLLKRIFSYKWCVDFAATSHWTLTQRHTSTSIVSNVFSVDRFRLDPVQDDTFKSTENYYQLNISCIIISLKLFESQ